MKTDTSDSAALWDLARGIVDDCRTAILSTSGRDNHPHATWMGAVAGPGLGEVLSITSPDSRKVANIRENGTGEWMFTSLHNGHIVYLAGPTEIVEDVADIKRCWKIIPEKQHAFFLKYYNSGVGFAIIRTRVEEVFLVEPKEYKTTKLVPSPPDPQEG